MKQSLAYLAALGLAVSLTACDQSGDDGHAHGPDSHTHADGTRHAEPPDSQAEAAPGDTHTHADGSTHAAHGSSEATDDHAEAEIGTVTIGDMDVELAQGHGTLAAGKESHLVVRLPETDSGETVVRAWIGTEDRTLSFVGRGEYNAANNAYDVHAVAPDPLPADAKWWIEIEKPDGTRVVGSADPITE